ncbi:MAG: hypothetical protein H6741_18925 [Alphaproteobacteria bacterium]|nr:hypothetical protein [Alphaproteobacteria bacterium]MCB9794784.1 hypothetical protein [Alphaproteobacteria bacterium]
MALPSPTLHGRRHRIRVLVTRAAGEAEQEVPLRLGLGSWLRYGLLGTWPPEQARALRADGDAVVLTYRDAWIPFEEPVLPFGYDRESEWAARFEPARGRWRLSRLRHLDFEGGGDLP